MCVVDLKFNKTLLPKLEKVVIAGEVLTNDLVYTLYNRFEGLHIINGYGPTEATVLITAVEIDKKMCEEISPLPIGYPMENAKIVFQDDAGKELSDGERGELVVIGDIVSPGYYKNAELSEKVFGTIEIEGKIKRFYKTGDLAYIKEGLVYYCGRKDFQIN